MKIKVIRTFIDKDAADPEKAEVEVGGTMNVTASRAVQLIKLRLARRIVSTTQKQTKARDRAQ